MRLWVGIKDVLKARKESTCPITLALQRKYPGDKVKVYWNLGVLFNEQEGERVFVIPSHVRYWIKKFDNGKKVPAIRINSKLESWKI